MRYVTAPAEISLEELAEHDLAWSPSMYARLTFANEGTTRTIREVLDQNRPYQKGIEPGSASYLDESQYYLIRTKALQEHSALIYPKGDAIVPINPHSFVEMHLRDEDILLSKDSNIGQCAMVDGDEWKRHALSGGIVRLKPTCDPFYLLAFLKHASFREQLVAKAPRGSTIAHARATWLDCRIPLPSHKGVKEVISILMRCIVEKEKEIKERATAIRLAIKQELVAGQKTGEFKFAQPAFSELQDSMRLDAATYDERYKSKIHLVENYRYGWQTPHELGFTVTPGPSLELRIIQTRVDSGVPKPGFYALILPTNISLYGTLTSLPYMGTGKALPLLQQGDVVFGEAGFHKGRSMVLVDPIERCTTNAHGLYARRGDGDLEKSIFFRCVFGWYRGEGLIDLMAVGGSGGHFSPAYFNWLKVPLFPEELQRQIVSFYHHGLAAPQHNTHPDDLLKLHRRRNLELGIFELDKERTGLWNVLRAAQEAVIAGEPVDLPRITERAVYL